MNSLYKYNYDGTQALLWELGSSRLVDDRFHIIHHTRWSFRTMDTFKTSAIAQATVAGVLFLIYAVRPILPNGPRWCRSFAKEAAWQTYDDEQGHDPQRYYQRIWARISVPALLLLLLPAAGLALSVVSACTTPLSFWSWLLLIPWTVSILIAAIERPRKTPKTLLAIYITIFVCEIAALASTYQYFRLANKIPIAEVGLALGAIGVILSMPMRDSRLASTGIAGCRDGPTFELRSPEDNLALWQFLTVSWMTPLIRAGSTRQLNNEDVWLLPYDFQHKRLLQDFRDLKGSLIKRLMLANGLDLIIITFLGILESAANLSNPVLLQRLLKTIELGSEYRKYSVKYAFFILLLRLCACQSGVLQLWFSRRAYERSRGEMITTIYAKTLTRKSQGFQPDEKDPVQVNGNALKGDEPENSRFSRLLMWLGLRKSRSQPKDESKSPATMGKILNLMRSDCYEVAQRFWDFPSLVTKPMQFILSIALVWTFLGWPCLLGIGWVVVVQLINAACLKMYMVREKLRKAATDARLQATSQFVEAIRPLRWYSWESKWLDKIVKARDHELYLKIVTGLWAVAISAVNTSAGALFPVLSFFAYTYIAGNPLPVNVAFPALQLFTMLEASLKELPDLFAVLINASIAVGRLETFMSEPDKEEGFYADTTCGIEFRDASLAWPGTHSPVLQNLNLSFSTGLTVVCGKVGAGKTALLQAILGELDKTGGDFGVPQQVIAYCAQSPWLQNMSIRDNILFCAPYDPVRYKQVLMACALTPDLSNFKHGDLSDIGENGIGLSGGQKARVALARAVYSQSPILLLDDPLAALDHHTAETIVRRLLGGPLVRGRTIVLVTHRVDLVTPIANQVIEIDGGRAHVLEANEIQDEVNEQFLQTNGHADAHEEQYSAAAEEEENAAIPDKFIEEEKRATGGVIYSVYWIYIKAGSLWLWATLVAIYAAFRLARLFSSWFLKSWNEAYETAASETTTASVTFILNTIKESDLPGQTSGSSFLSGIFDRLPNPQDEVKPWLLWYLGIAIAITLLMTASTATFIFISYTASKRLFVKVIHKVSNATFRFYDVTPVGRLMNRLTSDIGMLDGGIASPLQAFAFHSLMWTGSMVVIAVTTPSFFVFAIAMTAAFVYIFKQYIPTSQSLRRLEMASLSPLMSNFGILLDGLATIRAFKAQEHFQSRNIVVTDAFQKMDHFYWSVQSWLQYRFDALSAVSIFVLTMIALSTGFTSGLTAFVLVTASQLVDATHALCRVYGQLQMDFVSVERVVELLDLEEEPSGDLEPPVAWPAYGDDIEFDSVTLKYAPNLDPSVSDVSFTIPGGSTCAVLGRTGSGKSTLALALLATLQPTSGHIRVGDLDISQVNVHTWRQRITFVAQDPVLFPGTLRENLDPLEEHSDDECSGVLHRILPGWALSSHVDGGGKNLSQGQRQLVGIGRAVLRRSPVVVLDEATASIDKATALAIQDVLRDELKQSTVITIAHRLEAVKDADYLLRLDAGRVVECGPATAANM